MKVSFNWLKQYVDLPQKLSPEELALKLTMSTVEVEAVVYLGRGLDQVFVGEIVNIKKHPNADKLFIAEVGLGKKGQLKVVFGEMASVQGGDRVPVVIAPAELPTGQKLEKAKIRGEFSECMLCLDNELFIDGEQKLTYFDKKVLPGTPIKKAMGLDDTIIDIDNKSINHRPDLWGHYGIAREIAAIIGKKLNKYNAGKPKLGTKNYNITIKDKSCHRYAGLLVENVKVQESPDWLKQKLMAVGQRPINNIVDITNYVMFDLGKPIHAFDADKIEGNKIIVRSAEAGEKTTSLDGEERRLDSTMTVISDEKKPLAIGGIIGCANSEVDENTKNVLIETASFDATSIRQTSTKLGLRTEASMRFEKAIDPELVPVSAIKAASMILESCPEAKAVTSIVDIKSKSYKKKKVFVNITPDFINRRIGKEVKPVQMKKILESLEFRASAQGKKWKVEVPSFRATKDISIADDLVEEVARIYGYDNIKPVMPIAEMRDPQSSRERDFEHKLREVLALELGFDEVYNYSFMSDDERQKLGAREEQLVRVVNPLSAEQSFLRTSLIPGILKNIEKNQNNFNEMKIFELGRVYFRVNGLNSRGEKLPEETKKICGALVGNGRHEIIFRQAKGLFELLFARMRVSEQVKFVPLVAGSKIWQSGATVNIEANKRVIGQLGFVNRKMAGIFGLRLTPVMFNLDLQNIINNIRDKFSYERLPRYPAIELDLSIVIDKNVYWREIEGLIKSLNDDIIKGVKLFDVYEGKNIDQDKRSLAFRIIYRADDRTLTLEEAKTVQDRVVKILEEKFGGSIRDG